MEWTKARSVGRRGRRGASVLAAARLVLALGLLLSGCSRAYYGVWEQLGKDKRDLLVDRVEDARDSQQEAREEFRSALDVFREVVAVEGGELEALYDRMQAAYDRSVERAEAVRDRIDRVESVSEDLFEEWEDELDEYSDPDLRRRSAERLREARREFERLLGAMHRAEASMEPPLERFEDQVLFLKHNLNARAVASLEAETDRIASDVEALVEEMERSIREANEFIESMQAG